MKKILNIFCIVLVCSLLISCSNTTESLDETSIIAADYHEGLNFDIIVNSISNNNISTIYRINIPAIIKKDDVYFNKVINEYNNEVVKDIYYELTPSVENNKGDRYNINSSMVVITPSKSEKNILTVFVAYTNKNNEEVYDTITINYQDHDDLITSISQQKKSD